MPDSYTLWDFDIPFSRCRDVVLLQYYYDIIHHVSSLTAHESKRQRSVTRHILYKKTTS